MTKKHARQEAILHLVATHVVGSQEELRQLLLGRGMDVTQATLSRDLDELGVVRRRAGGTLVYALPEEAGGPGSHPGGAGPPTATRAA